MTQWLIEEAASETLEIAEMRERSGVAEEDRAAQLLVDRHAELVALREQMRAG